MARSELPNRTVTFLFTDIEARPSSCTKSGPSPNLGRVETNLGDPHAVFGIRRGRGAVPGARERHGAGGRAAAALREELEMGMSDAFEEQIHERALADARAALGEEAFTAAWARVEP
jgi:hypothetical protein